jgi:multiple sugar transport system ATP-binding protein
MVKEVAELLNLSSVLDKKPSGLDVGAKQRVAIARAVVRRPKIYLFDEPLTNLDPRKRVQLRFELKRLQKDLEQTIIFVTHDQAEALTMGDKIGVMNEGALLQYDIPDNVYNNPQDKFVAFFIGNPGMNLIQCEIGETGTRTFLETNGFSYDITDLAENIRKHSSSKEVILGIRPEYVEVSTEKQGRNWINSKCVVAESMGNRTLVNLHLGEKTIRAKTSLPKIPEMVWFNMPKKHIRIFDRKTGKLII